MEGTSLEGTSLESTSLESTSKSLHHNILLTYEDDNDNISPYRKKGVQDVFAIKYVLPQY